MSAHHNIALLYKRNILRLTQMPVSAVHGMLIGKQSKIIGHYGKFKHHLVNLSVAISSYTQQMFLYTVLFSIFFKGRTPGKLLLHFSIQNLNGQYASALNLIVRYTLLYSGPLLFCLLPQFTAALGMTTQALELLIMLSLIFGLSVLTYYSIVVWMFPSRDYPWGTLSKTRAALTHPHS